MKIFSISVHFEGIFFYFLFNPGGFNRFSILCVCSSSGVIRFKEEYQKWQINQMKNFENIFKIRTICNAAVRMPNAHIEQTAAQKLSYELNSKLQSSIMMMIIIIICVIMIYYVCFAHLSHLSHT